MNITLAVDEQVAEQARKAASPMGKSLNQAVRDYLERCLARTLIPAISRERECEKGRGG